TKSQLDVWGAPRRTVGRSGAGAVDSLQRLSAQKARAARGRGMGPTVVAGLSPHGQPPRPDVAGAHPPATDLLVAPQPAFLLVAGLRPPRLDRAHPQPGLTRCRV